MALISVQTNETELSNTATTERLPLLVNEKRKTEGNAGKVRETKKNINQKLLTENENE